MKLPHLEPLVFAKEVLYVDDESAKVLCEFEQFPTIGVFIEAAAQSSAAFFQGGEPKTGYLANVTNMELLDSIEVLQYIVSLKKIFSFENLVKYSFLITQKGDNKKIAQGELTVAIEQ